MRLRTHPGPLFKFLIANADDAAHHGGALQAMFARTLDGVILRGALSPAAVDAAVTILEQETLPAQTIGYTNDRARPAYTIGATLITCPSIDEYLDDAPAQRRRLAALFGREGAFEARICGLLSALAGGLPTDAATGPDGRPCPFASVRVLTEGTEIGLHVGNEFARVAQAEHLRATLDLSDQLSWFCPLSAPEGGGELIVYGLEWSDVCNLVRPREDGGAHIWLEGSEVFEAVRGLESSAFTPGPGDLLVFDGGRYFHRVSKVEGRRPRRTIGGFLTFSRGHDSVHIWT